MSERRDVVGLGVTSLTSALWVNALGLLVPAMGVLLVWMLTPQQAGLGADIGTTLRFSAALWVWAHFIPMVTGSGEISLFPMLILALPAVLLVRASRKAAQELEIGNAREAIMLSSGMATAHGVVLTTITALISHETLRFRPIQTFLIAFVVAALVSSVTIFRQSGAWEDLRDVIPSWFRSGVIGVAVFATALMVASGIVLATALVVHRADVAAVANSLGSGFITVVVVVLLSLMYLPNLWGWAFAAFTGAGIHVGGGSVLTLGAGTTGALPPFPILAALPDASPGWIRVFPVVVVAAAAIAVLLAWRRDSARDYRTAGVVVLGSTLIIGAIALFSGGSLGDGNLGDLGPHARNALLLGLTQVFTGAAIPVFVDVLKQRKK